MPGTFFHHLIVAGVTLLAFGCPVCTACGVEVALRREVAQTSAVVRLGDVAEVIDADRALCRELANLILMPSPAPGADRFLTRRELSDLLADRGANLDQLRFSGAERIVISAKPTSTIKLVGHQEIDREMQRRAAMFQTSSKTPKRALLADGASSRTIEQLQDAIGDYLNAQTGQRSMWKVAFDLPERHRQQLLAAVSIPSCQGGSGPWVGPQRFVISFDTTEGVVSFPLYAEVAAAEPIVVALHPIARGKIITAADIELRQVDAQPMRLRKDAIHAIEDVVGLEAGRPISVGEALSTDHVRSPIVVKRGEPVAVTSQGKMIRVRTTARAKQDGARGELIQVESLETRERFDARVTGPGEVAIFMPPGPSVARGAVTTRKF